jgi:hypothetical protein
MLTDELLEKILARIDVNEHGCWLWQGALTGGGYGNVRYDGRVYTTHRVVYAAIVGHLPAELDHLCRERSCCCPDHLEPVTRSENTVRGNSGVLRLVCSNGHWLLGDNVSLVHYGDRPVERRCKTCNRDRVRARRAATKAARS